MKTERGIRFHHMGGVGTIHCKECAFSIESVISFIHGKTPEGVASCCTGYQCLDCGEIKGIGNPSVCGVPPCECGGGLSRDHLLFCPQCKSTDLSYKMKYIT